MALNSLGGIPVSRAVSLKPYATLRAGGRAEYLAIAESSTELADLAAEAQRQNILTTVLGSGSNILPSDDGVPGLTIVNQARRIAVARTGEVLADTGASFQDLFLKTAQAGLGGLEYAVGIPGTIGGALVSNAGAYRSCVSEFLTGIEIVTQGERSWVEPAFMDFRYRDSRLRRPDPVPVVMLRVRMHLPQKSGKAIYDEAREYQRQRISKQPPPASAGSFFKNVTDAELAENLEGLPISLKKAGIVPAGYLIEAAGMKGSRLGGAMMGARHANFMLNVGNATAFEIRRLAGRVIDKVGAKFGVRLEEEVLYLGEWRRFSAIGP